MKIVLLGAGGQLATDLVPALKDQEVVALNHTQLEMRDYERVRQLLTELAPDVVINTTAFHQLDACEADPETSFAVNAISVRNLAEVCSALDCALIHLSTDYVFAGEKGSPYIEEDTPHPVNVYGASKLAGEHFVQTLCPKHFVVRSSGLYGRAGSSGKGGNFVETMLKLAREGKSINVVNDQVLAPTYTVDLAEKLVELLETKSYGLYHITSSGQCSWFEFAEKIFELADMTPDLNSISTETFGTSVRRPAYSALTSSRLEGAGIVAPRSWKAGLAAYLQAKAHPALEQPMVAAS